ncbi:dTDP-glucose 4,6-dehydratase [Collibacillus ludicampi]|jgi:UDP-glucose 4-epimerase|uniref:dTDP-glucose 4,6-dehydratase n=1 Tax=Collibacillus ludicampi TaxID=2771369 RepID=A0AAV4LF34_9BACL|nr:GDP-mannose 4,6-dehydratase [Collibacillus ludicampi]GIM46475.1 dTDP-glucose 4,6-dehydratase [Collibacillus ludicampi]
MKALVTGGSGFIGRWLVKQLLDDGHKVWVLDDLSNGRLENIYNLQVHSGFQEFMAGNIQDVNRLQSLFRNKFDICFHLAAKINVQESIDDPKRTFENDIVGTFNLLEECRENGVKFVLMSTCMVYHHSIHPEGIRESDQTKPASPYAGAKIAAENLVLSYYYAYGLPAVVLRPFNTYGPYQKTGGEGGVIPIFIRNKLSGEVLKIYGDGTQTRDFLYVEDCARFVALAGYSDQVNGEILHAGLGKDISINALAKMIVQDETRIIHVPHIHPQSEIAKLLCNYSKAKEKLGWEPLVSLEEGLKRTEDWIRNNHHE